MTPLINRLIFSMSATFFIGTAVYSGENPETVSLENYALSETNMQIDRMLKASKGVNQFEHYLVPTPIDKQNVIRMNRDTLYSFAVVDISKGATVTIPDTGERYLTMMVINNDGYINKVFYGGGSYKLNKDQFDTDYVVLVVRTLVNSTDNADVKAVNELQGKMKIEAASANSFDMPKYDMDSYKAVYEPLLDLSKFLTSTEKTFGSKDEVDPIRFLLGTASGWGGLPIKDAYYLSVEPDLPVGEYQITAKDVPVDAFWSVSVYNKDGYFQKNDFNSYNVNNISGRPNDDGSLTVNLGGCEDKRVNCIPLTDGWNYTVRLYKPSAELLDGTWVFPSVQSVTK